jgi:hypothetical protein
MLPSVVDDPARALNSETWEDLGREFLWSHARFGIVDHAVRKNARANNGPLAGYLARDSLYIWALCPVDHGPPHGDPITDRAGEGREPSEWRTVLPICFASHLEPPPANRLHRRVDSTRSGSLGDGWS